MLLGHWKNIEELEESLCLDELELIVKAAREREKRNQIFLAALKGINLEDEVDENKERFERAQRRANAILQNKTKEDIERDEFKEFGIKLL